MQKRILKYLVIFCFLTVTQFCFGGDNKTEPKVTITLVKTDKVLYAENDSAKMQAYFENKSGSPKPGKVIVRLYYDLGKSKEIANQKETLRTGRSALSWKFNVGPQTYGRAVEVSFLDNAGKVIASCQEYFSVAREWLRVQIHGTSRYRNHHHWFSSEPTGFGTQPTDAEVYLSSQVRYRVDNKRNRRAIPVYQKKGIKTTFYQNRAFSDIMGYEEVRKHPEYAIYDLNGQFGVDPVYKGYPDPFELASPLEMGPKRKKIIGKKTYLDHPLTAWHKVIADFANPDALEYGTMCSRRYAEKYGYDGVYLDDTPSLQSGGYNYKGGKIVGGMTKEQLAKINADIAHVWQKTLKEKDPYFATWVNGISPRAVRFWRSAGLGGKTMGTGVDVEKGEDVNDDYIRELTSWKNTSFLYEVQHSFTKKDAPYCYPDKWQKSLLENRDYLIQKYGATAVFGYICHRLNSKNPGPSKWGWPTLNYFLALATATQHHHIVFGQPIPSLEPFNQFAARYSRFFWARDIKTMPEKKVDEILIVKSKKKLLWKDFVYTRKTEKSGEDIIIHLVRPYPLEKWDLDWEVRPAPINDAILSISALPGKKLAKAFAVRQYQYGEPEQVVEKTMSPVLKNNKLSFKISPFRYYTMVVLRFVKK